MPTRARFKSLSIDFDASQAAGVEDVGLAQPSIGSSAGLGTMMMEVPKSNSAVLPIGSLPVQMPPSPPASISGPIMSGQEFCNSEIVSTLIHPGIPTLTSSL